MEKKKEIWLDVPGYESILQVSNTQKLRTKDRYVRCIGGVRLVKGREHKLRKNSKGYLYTTVGRGGKTIFLHRAVAIVFVPNPDNKPCIDHINGDITDNRPENLRWCTQQENMSFPLARKHISEGITKIINNETYKKNKSEAEKNKWTDEYRKRISETQKQVLARPEVRKKHINNPKKSKPVIQLTLDGTFIAEFPSTHQAERDTNINSGSIRSCIRGYQKTAGGYKWICKENYVS